MADEVALRDEVTEALRARHAHAGYVFVGTDLSDAVLAVPAIRRAVAAEAAIAERLRRALDEGGDGDAVRVCDEIEVIAYGCYECGREASEADPCECPGEPTPYRLRPAVADQSTPAPKEET